MCGRAIWSKQIRFSQRWTSVSLRPSSRMTRRSSPHDQEAASEVKAEIAKRETELKFADLEYNRSRGLFSRKAIAREEYDLVESKLETAKATLAGAKAKLRTAEQAINAAEADVKQTQVKIDDSTLKSPVKGRVLYRLAEPGEVVALGGKLLTLINLNDIYMEVFLPAQEAARVKIGADARIVLDARPGYAAPAKASYVSPEAQFTPKQVETRSERDKLMFRVKLKVPAEIVLPVHRSDQDRRSGYRLRSARRHGGVARLSGKTLPQALIPGAA